MIGIVHTTTNLHHDCRSGFCVQLFEPLLDLNLEITASIEVQMSFVLSSCVDQHSLSLSLSLSLENE